MSYISTAIIGLCYACFPPFSPSFSSLTLSINYLTSMNISYVCHAVLVFHLQYIEECFFGSFFSIGSIIIVFCNLFCVLDYQKDVNKGMGLRLVFCWEGHPVTHHLLRGFHGISARVWRREQNRRISEALLGQVTYCFFLELAEVHETLIKVNIYKLDTAGELTKTGNHLASLKRRYVKVCCLIREDFTKKMLIGLTF